MIETDHTPLLRSGICFCNLQVFLIYDFSWHRNMMGMITSHFSVLASADPASPGTLPRTTILGTSSSIFIHSLIYLCFWLQGGFSRKPGNCIQWCLGGHAVPEIKPGRGEPCACQVCAPAPWVTSASHKDIHFSMKRSTWVHRFFFPFLWRNMRDTFFYHTVFPSVVICTKYINSRKQERGALWQLLFEEQEQWKAAIFFLYFPGRTQIKRQLFA